MLKAAKQAVKDTFNIWPDVELKREFEGQKFYRYNERPVEFAFVFRKLAELAPKTVLDVGAGDTAVPYMLRNCGCIVTATDNIRDYWPNGMRNRHWLVLDDDIRDTKLTGPFDMVTCISTLEHIDRFDDAVRSMFKLVRPGGHVIVTCPYNETSFKENCYLLPDSAYGKDEPYPARSYSRAEVNRWLADNGATLVEQEFWRYWTGEHWTQGKQIIPPERSSAVQAHQHTCMLFRKTASD